MKISIDRASVGIIRGWNNWHISILSFIFYNLLKSNILHNGNTFLVINKSMSSRRKPI